MLTGYPQVLTQREVLEQFYGLPRTRETEAHPFVRWKTVERVVEELDVSSGLREAGETVHEAGLAGAVRSDQTDDLPFPQLEGDVINSVQASVGHGELRRAQSERSLRTFGIERCSSGAWRGCLLHVRLGRWSFTVGASAPDAFLDELPHLAVGAGDSNRVQHCGQDQADAGDERVVRSEIEQPIGQDEAQPQRREESSDHRS